MTSSAISGAGLRPPHNRYDHRVRAWWRWRVGLVSAAAAGVCVVVAALLASARGWFALVAALIAIAGIVSAVTLPVLWHEVGRWEVTAEAVYTRTGYFVTTWRVAPISRIQRVDTSRGPLQQRFGLATVVVTTASSAGAVRIIGLDEALAARLADELTLITNANLGDAT